LTGSGYILHGSIDSDAKRFQIVPRAAMLRAVPLFKQTSYNLINCVCQKVAKRREPNWLVPHINMMNIRDTTN
jgi:hypothetical protein